MAILMFHTTPTGGYLSKRRKSKEKQVVVSRVDWFKSRTATDDYFTYGWTAHYYSLEPNPVKRDYRLQNTFDDE